LVSAVSAANSTRSRRLVSLASVGRSASAYALRSSATCSVVVWSAPDWRYHVPAGRTPARSHRASSFTCVPEESPRETNGPAGAGGARESSTASAPDCSTVYVVPSRSGRSLVVHAASAPHISPAPSLRRVAMCRIALLLALVSLPGRASAQGFPLTVESIMRGPDVVGTAPSNVRFSADGRYVYFAWRSPGVDTLDQDYRVAVAGAPQAPERLPRFAVDTIAMATGGSAWSPDL